MPKEQSVGNPTTRRYAPEEKAQAVRMVRQLRKELGTSQGTVQRVADQLGYGVESVRLWVKQADIDAGEGVGTTTAMLNGSAGSSRRTGSCAGRTRSSSEPRLSSRRSSTAHRSDRRVHRWQP